MAPRVQPIAKAKDRTRRRLPPEVRRDLILDQTASLVLAEGLAGVSMERVGREAGVSKALVHAYFPRRTELLRALLLREYRRFQSRGRELLANVKGFEQTVRATTAAFLDHVAERGALIELLMHEPDVAAALEGVDAQERLITAHYFGRQVAAEYGLEESTAVTVADLLMGLTGAAGNRLHRTGCDREELLELVVGIIFAALDDISRSESPPRRA